MLANPFLYQGYEGPEYFCDRKEETALLKSNLRNGRNVTLISPRRIGKTGLIKNAFYELAEQNPDAIFLYIDIYATKSLNDFVRMFGSTIMNEVVSRNISLLDKLLTFFSSLRPVLGLDPLTGSPTVSISVEPSQEEMTMRNIFNYLDNCGSECFIAIDEFQQISEYEETGTEALLRSYIQFSPKVHFIFSGSKFHLMSEMFTSPKHPFYQSTEIMELKPLDRQVYYEFCNGFFERKGGSLSRDIFSAIYDEYGGHTWYIQCIMNRLYEDADNVTETGQVNECLAKILAGREPQYENLIQFLTNNQYKLLKAIALAGTVKAPTSAAFIRKYDLSAASSVKQALKSLEDKELVYKTATGHIVYDRFMGLWLSRRGI